jgi:hypothetical protein
MKILIPLFLLLFCVGCEEEEGETSAKIEFKSGVNYTSQDGTVAKGSQITVGIVADKAENNFKKYNVSVAYDGALTTVTVMNFIITSDENIHYEKDITFSVRNQSGNEKYYFTIADTDGNLIQKAISLSVE